MSATKNSSVIGDRVRNLIINAITDYDIRQSKKRGYNPYALAQYYAAMDEVENAVARGVDLMDAIGRAFTDRLHDCVAKAALDAMEKSGNRP